MSLDDASCCHVHRLDSLFPVPYRTSNNVQLLYNELGRVGIRNGLYVALGYAHRHHCAIELQEVKTLSISGIAGCTNNHRSSTWAACGLFDILCKLRRPFLVPAVLRDIDKYLLKRVRNDELSRNTLIIYLGSTILGELLFLAYVDTNHSISHTARAYLECQMPQTAARARNHHPFSRLRSALLQSRVYSDASTKQRCGQVTWEGVGDRCYVSCGCKRVLLECSGCVVA
jgi:hypothetical protein